MVPWCLLHVGLEKKPYWGHSLYYVMIDHILPVPPECQYKMTHSYFHLIWVVFMQYHLIGFISLIPCTTQLETPNSYNGNFALIRLKEQYTCLAILYDFLYVYYTSFNIKHSDWFTVVVYCCLLLFTVVVVYYCLLLLFIIFFTIFRYCLLLFVTIYCCLLLFTVVDH